MVYDVTNAGLLFHYYGYFSQCLKVNRKLTYILGTSADDFKMKVDWVIKG